MVGKTDVAAASRAAAATPAAEDRGRSAGSASAADLTEGEVRKVDVDGAKVTLKHADIKSLDMPPMTMVFNVKDKALLDNVKVGDKVRFKAVNDAGKFTVTEIQVVR
ncbi:MAG: copper-binding protein [Caldimonas sp.]